ncbi:hypothetical protein BDZ91DRAFT_748571 [Kalaharituber pfeilii]|nr:hypothetical protein BDZ91DRAFT_748571 [Kalaharituber pfeilii]
MTKHSEALDALYTLSPAISILETGCVTPLPQPGNPQPRLFRLPSTESLLNRYGFNSLGANHVATVLRTRVRRFARAHHIADPQAVLDGLPDPNNPVHQPLPASLIPGRLLAIQIGKNATTDPGDLPGVIRDYVSATTTLADYADLIVVNVSSPNTPGLRTLQSKSPLTHILSAVVEAADRANRRVKPKVLVKVSPDEDSPQQISDICDAVRDAGVSGIIVANTTTRRTLSRLDDKVISDADRTVFEREKGGVSGPALYKRMLGLVERYREALDERGLWERMGVENGGAETPGDKERRLVDYWASSRRPDGVGVTVIASGGVRTGAQAVEAMRRGAAAVMAYTAMVYGGVGTHGRMAEEMRKVIRGG